MSVISTENVVRKHLQTFLDQKGVAAIVEEYDDAARLYSSARTYQGPREIGEFFTDFIRSLPSNPYERFALGSLRVDGDLAFITWSIGEDVPLGTDTFIVRNGKIVSQTFAMYAAPSP